MDAVTRKLEARIAALEAERKQLQAEAEEWEEQMAKWTVDGVPIDKQLEMTITELRKVRANYFQLVEDTIPALKEENADLKLSEVELQTAKEEILVAAHAKDVEVENMKIAREADKATIGSLTGQVQLLAKQSGEKDVKIGKLEHYRNIIWWVASIAAAYAILRFIKLTPWGRSRCSGCPDGYSTALPGVTGHRLRKGLSRRP